MSKWKIYYGDFPLSSSCPHSQIKKHSGRGRRHLQIQHQWNYSLGGLSPFDPSRAAETLLAVTQGQDIFIVRSNCAPTWVTDFLSYFSWSRSSQTGHDTHCRNAMPLPGWAVEVEQQPEPDASNQAGDEQRLFGLQGRWFCWASGGSSKPLHLSLITLELCLGLLLGKTTPFPFVASLQIFFLEDLQNIFEYGNIPRYPHHIFADWLKSPAPILQTALIRVHSARNFALTYHFLPQWKKFQCVLWVSNLSLRQLKDRWQEAKVPIQPSTGIKRADQ